MRSRRLRQRLPVAVLLLLLGLLPLGCDDESDGIAGPCIHEYQEAVLKIVRAENAQSGEDLTSVPASALIQEFADRVELEGDSILCDPPCGFGTREGRYAFTAIARGHAPKEMSLDVAYKEFHGGCPSYNRGGVEIEIALEPR